VLLLGTAPDAQKTQVLFPPRISNKYENTTYLTIFGRYEIEKNNCRGNNNNNKNKNKKKKKKKNKHKHKHKNATNRYVVRWFQAGYQKGITLCSAPARTRRAHAQHQRSHYCTEPLWQCRCAKCEAL